MPESGNSAGVARLQRAPEHVSDPAPGRTLGRAVRRVLAYCTFGVYAVAAPFGCVGVAVLGWLWRHDEHERSRRLQSLTSGAYRLMHDWLRFARIADFDHRDALRGVPRSSCVVVANHPTLMDVTAILASLGRGFTVVKPALHGQRLLRPFLVGAGHVAGSSDDPVSTGRVVDEAVHRVQAGFPLVVFPEGTRSPADGLHPFGRTAFEIACRARVPVVCLTIECRPLMFAKGMSLFHTPAATPQLRLTVLAIEDPKGCNFDSRALLQRVESRYRRWQGEGRLADIPPDR